MANPFFNLMAVKVFRQKMKTVKCPNCGRKWRMLKSLEIRAVTCNRCGTSFPADRQE